jgi:hypothetical protein
MEITLEQAISLLKSGGQLGNRHSYIRYDPDFDDVEWGKPFAGLKCATSPRSKK